jgi:hypothetical protein
MLMGDLIRTLQDGGINARHWHIRHLIAAGAVKTPPRDSSGRFQFTNDDYRQIRGRLEGVVSKQPRCRRLQADVTSAT